MTPPQSQPSDRKRQIHRVCERLDEFGVPTHDELGAPLSLMLRLGVLAAERDDALAEVTRLRAALLRIGGPAGTVVTTLSEADAVAREALGKTGKRSS